MPRVAGDTRERARIIGDPKWTMVLLPASRGIKGRTLLAKTCLECGELKDAAAFPPSGGARTLGPHCDACQTARWDAMPTPRRAAQQAQTLETATHHGEEWTGPQLKIALREDLSMEQAAKMLGRTLMAVRNIRRRFGVTKA